jgi:hypothetical protein
MLAVVLGVGAVAAAGGAGAAPLADIEVQALDPCVPGTCVAVLTYRPAEGDVATLEVDWDHAGEPEAVLEPDLSLPCAGPPLPVDELEDALPVDPPSCVVTSPPFATGGDHAIAVRLTGADGSQSFWTDSVFVDAFEPEDDGQDDEDDGDARAAPRGGAGLCPPVDPGVHCGPGKSRQTAGGDGQSKASHRGWPKITGIFWMVEGDGGHAAKGSKLNDELLGHHGSDTLAGGPGRDVIWGDWESQGNGAGQRDRLDGGPGDDFIYGSHGTNVIRTGPGRDVVRVHWGRGSIACGSPKTIVYISHKARPRYKLRGCKRVSYKTDRQVHGGR